MNFAALILEAAQANPSRTALVAPRWVRGEIAAVERVDYAEFLHRVSGWQNALRLAGLTAGDRVVLIVPPSLALYALFTALLALGVVPVLFERGMSRHRIAASLRASGARAVIGERSTLRLWWLFPPLWRMCALNPLPEN